MVVSFICRWSADTKVSLSAQRQEEVNAQETLQGGGWVVLQGGSVMASRGGSAGWVGAVQGRTSPGEFHVVITDA